MASPQPLTEHEHPRAFGTNRYIYPVLSRRAGGVSVGVNLTPGRECNFDCVYCQVDRSRPAAARVVELGRLLDELRAVLSGLQPRGALWEHPAFALLPADQQRVADLAFSGDGEPTVFPRFLDVVQAAVHVKETLGFGDAKVVVITNASSLRHPRVKEALQFLDGHQGEVWAKLDAGTPEQYELVNRARQPYATIVENILACARERPVVIQSCFVRLRGVGPDEQELTAYVDRLRELKAAGAQLRLVQVCTVARRPAYGMVSSLPDGEVDAIAARVRAEAGVEAHAYYGQVPEGQGLCGDEPAA